MDKIDFNFDTADGKKIYGYKWDLEEGTSPKGVVQIAHGMAETAARYDRFAKRLNEKGYIVYANDHRGHGRTAESVENVGYLGEDGYNWMVKDMYQLTEIIKKENPSLKLFLYGHSMGSMLSQRYISLYGSAINGVILSGTAGRQDFATRIGIRMSKRELNKIGPKAQSKKMNNLTFGNYNKAFKPNRTEFDWLSRDTAEVDKYVNDPYCGGVFSAQFFYDFLTGLRETQKKSNMVNIPKELPIYVTGGDKDPVGKNLKLVMPLINEYKSLGIKDVSFKFYKDGRHEILNETNRDEVMNDIIDWLDKH